MPLKSLKYNTFNMNTLNQNQIKSSKLINYISTIFGCLTIYFLYKVLKTFILTSTVITELGIFIALDIIPIVVVPIATILFWSRKKSGWVLLTIFSSYSILSSILSLTMAPNILYIANSGLEYKNFLISALVNLLLFLFFLATVIILCKANIREIYQVNKKTIFITFGTMLGVLITLAFLLVTMVLSHFV